ncbi:MBL fold metallo-hydrolase [Luteolibacter marinus]|uniref:MBL fold metallo-hydrolase n=1 Tax=Luteolibacter marinus TaxID=2776705 RepID=UPI0018683680|nr:MBL fold metallo-hydrolase [Luteolibacter marinus]
MAADFELTFLGTGTSVGVPVIGCQCRVCQSEDPRNKRTRSSVHVRCGEISVLVDSGPDLREQALREKMTRVDAVIYTHPHVDHVVGFDELRAFCWHREGPLPLHATAECMEVLVRMFGWAFSPENIYGGYIKPDPQLIEGPFAIGDLRITPLPVEHAKVLTVGFLFEAPGSHAVAYIPDAKRVPPETIGLLKRADVLILDALRPAPHPTHLSTDEALEIIRQTGVPRAWLTHLGHDNEHHELEAILPEGVGVAWDGLRIHG